MFYEINYYTKATFMLNNKHLSDNRLRSDQAQNSSGYYKMYLTLIIYHISMDFKSLIEPTEFRSKLMDIRTK